jgi:tight adherence protein C
MDVANRTSGNTSTAPYFAKRFGVLMSYFTLSPHHARVLEIDPERLSRYCTIRSGIAFSVGAIFLTTLLMTGVSISLLISVLLIIGFPVLIWILSISRLQQMASQLQRDMDLAVAVFLDLINVLLAGGAGIETAMLAAASAGDGWGFEQLRMAMARAQSSRRSYWDSLRETGEAYGIDSLEEVANSVQLAGEHGARIRQSLTAKASSLRIRNLARIEHEAEQRTERMGIPVVLLFIGFIVLVGYPAFAGTVSAL